MKLAELLHLCLISRKTGTVSISTPDGDASLYLNSGEIVDAQFGSLRGQDAFFEISARDDCHCELNESDSYSEKTITLRTEHLLMEAARRIDEGSSGSDQPPVEDSSPSRFEMLQVTEALPTRFTLSQGRNLIGRARDCSIHIPNTTVSGHHTEVVIRDDEIQVTDLNSSNGTFLNGSRVNRSEPVQVGDQIQIGACILEVVDQGGGARVPHSGKAVDAGKQDTRKFSLPDLAHASPSSHIAPNAFKEFHPVQEDNSGSSNPTISPLVLILVGILGGALIVTLIFFLTR